MTDRHEMTDGRAWTIGAVAGLVVAVLLWILTGIGFLASVFWGIVIALMVAILLLLQGRSRKYEGAPTPSTEEATRRKAERTGATPMTAEPVPSPPKVNPPKPKAPLGAAPEGSAPMPTIGLAGTTAARAEPATGAPAGYDETYTGAAQTPREADPADPAVDTGTGQRDEAGAGISGAADAGAPLRGETSPMRETVEPEPADEGEAHAPDAGDRAPAAGTVVAGDGTAIAGDEDGSPMRASTDAGDEADAGAALRGAYGGPDSGSDTGAADVSITDMPGAGGAPDLGHEPGAVAPGEDVERIAEQEDRPDLTLAGAVEAEAGGAEVGTKPAALDGPRGGTADDLKMVRGIGPKLEDMLHGMGIYHYDQIASWGPAEVAWCDANLKGFRGRVTRDTWVDQAKLLAAGEETEFAAKAKKDDIYGDDD